METERSVFESIWLADDDHDDQLVFENVVRELLPVVNLTLFTDSEKLLNELKRNTPDLLFLDIDMPGQNGKQCLKIIKESPAYRKLPVIMLTGHDYYEDMKTCYIAGAALYIIKHYSYAKLKTCFGHLFQLNWDNPESIANNQYVNNRFVPFSVECLTANLPKP